MNRFYVNARDIDRSARVIRITDPRAIHHMSRVLRLRQGEEIFVSDGEGGGYVAAFPAVVEEELVLPIVRIQPRRRREDRRLRLTVACAVPKYAHFEEVIDKGTQLEVDEIVPLITDRTMVTPAAVIKKRGRWERLMLAAAKQSGAIFLPSLRGPVSFEVFLRELGGFELCLLPHLAELTKTLPQVLSGFAGGRLCVMIGPEGD